jgi:hypothetical protein
MNHSSPAHGLKDVASVLNDRKQPTPVPPTKTAILSILEKTR